MLAACRVEHDRPVACSARWGSGDSCRALAWRRGLRAVERAGMRVCFIHVFQLVFSKIRIRRAHVCRIGLLQCIQGEPRSLSRSGAAPDKTRTSLWTRVELPISQGGR